MTEETLPSPAEMPFGAALDELERIVASLECGESDLEESMRRYERGVGLLRALQTRLSDAQQRVTALIGELEPEDVHEGATE